MADDQHPCSGCPFLDLGHRYPVGDVRDPWRRMPKLFEACVSIFGRPFYNHNGKARQHGEKLLRHYCRVQREKYGLCTKRRSVLCQEIVLEALTFAAHAPDTQNRIARSWGAIRRTVNSDITHEKLKPTVIQPAADLELPTVRFRQVPAA